MSLRRLFILFILLSAIAEARGQAPKPIRRGYYSIYRKNDSEYLVRGLCNGFELTLPHNSERLAYYMMKSGQGQSPFLTVHGLISYDYMYRTSLHDTYDQKDLQQHTVQANLTLLVRDRYPLHLNFTTRRSNSPFYPNYFAPGLQLDQPDLDRRAKKELMDAVQQKIMDRPDLKMLREALEKETAKYLGLKKWLNSPDLAQEIIEARERAYIRKMRGGKDSLEADKISEWNRDLKMRGLLDDEKDSLQKKFPRLDSLDGAQWMSEKKKQVDSLQKNMERLRHKTDSLYQQVNSELANVRKDIEGAKSNRELQQIALKQGLEQPSKKSGGNVLANFTKLGIGRSQVNYTELTAWNISLTGIDLEYNPRFYSAFALGKVDYGFRDFLGKNRRPNGQELALARLGWGMKEHRALIFTVFNGRKYNYANGLSDSAAHTIPVLGYSVEAVIKTDERRWLSAEVAKSTYPVTGNLHDNGAAGSLFDFRDKSNLGINIKGAYSWPQTGTNLTGFYRKTGTYFQSFSLYTYNTNQTAWQLKGDQQFLNGKVGMTLMLRQNDFTNPYLEKTYKTSTVFKTVQIRVQVPHWPVLNAGYYPGTQLYVVDGTKMRESVYYIFNGSLMHTYALGRGRGVSTLVFNRYFNQSTDSGFVAYKGTNYLFSQNFFFGGLQLKAGGAYTDQQELRYSTAEGGLNFSVSKTVRLGAGGKYNKVVKGGSYWGSRFDVVIALHSLGNFQLQYEKSYLPTIQHSLYATELGRVSWYKYF